MDGSSRDLDLAWKVFYIAVVGVVLVGIGWRLDVWRDCLFVKMRSQEPANEFYYTLKAFVYLPSKDFTPNLPVYSLACVALWLGMGCLLLHRDALFRWSLMRVVVVGFAACAFPYTALNAVETAIIGGFAPRVRLIMDSDGLTGLEFGEIVVILALGSLILGRGAPPE
jgi:hypothetical protein